LAILLYGEGGEQVADVRYFVGVYQIGDDQARS